MCSMVADIDSIAAADGRRPVDAPVDAAAWPGVAPVGTAEAAGARGVVRVVESVRVSRTRCVARCTPLVFRMGACCCCCRLGCSSVAAMTPFVALMALRGAIDDGGMAEDAGARGLWLESARWWRIVAMVAGIAEDAGASGACVASLRSARSKLLPSCRSGEACILGATSFRCPALTAAGGDEGGAGLLADSMDVTVFERPSDVVWRELACCWWDWE